VLTRIAADPSLRTTTLASRRDRRPPGRRLTLPESSWGFAKGHASWVTEETRPLWRLLRSMSSLARTTLAGGKGDERLRSAVARELALLHASDWPFMLTRGRSGGYATERMHGHAERIRELCDAITRGTSDVQERGLADVPPATAALLAALDPATAGDGAASRPRTERRSAG